MRLFLMAAVSVFLVAADKDDPGDKDRQKLQGTWALESGMVDGKKLTDEHIKKSKITHAGKECELTTPHQSDEPIKARTTRVDPTKEPAEMDWVRDKGPGKGMKMMAIYEWDGPDRYKVCFDPSGKERPKDFSAKAGSGHILHVWKRVKD